jgi:hypothetical protein
VRRGREVLVDILPAIGLVWLIPLILMLPLLPVAALLKLSALLVERL